MQAFLLLFGWACVMASSIVAGMIYSSSTWGERTSPQMFWTAVGFLVVGLVSLGIFKYRDHNSARRRYQMARKVTRGGPRRMSQSWLDRFTSGKSMI